MLSSGIPAKFPIIWGASAAYINAIPTTSQIGINNGFASLPDGFVPLNQTPVAAGGVPPRIQDLNGILNELSAWSQWYQAGGPLPYDSTFQSAVGGYPKGAVVGSVTTAGTWWRSTADNNTTNPDTGGAGWVNFFGTYVPGAAGYEILPTGKITQWGLAGPFASESGISVSFSIPFPNSITNVQTQVITYPPSLSSFDQLAQPYSITLSGMGVYCQVTGGGTATFPVNVYWRAEGN